MRILVTGAAGMLGVDLIEHLAARHDPIGVDLDMDVTDAAAVAARLADESPDAVIHCAAWTDVDGAEAAEDLARAVNATGSGNVAAACRDLQIPVVCVSTDYVFSGSAADDYAEDAPTAPIGAYGRTKRAGELAALREHPGGVRIARTSWLYGAAGRNFVDTMLRLAATGEEVAVVADQVGSPTWTRDLAPALEALIGLGPGVYHTTGGGSTSWADFAEAIFAGAGVDCRVRRITTPELGRPAPRPARSVLAVTRPDAPRLRHWRDALTDYLREKQAA